MPQIWTIYYISNCRQARPVPKPKFVAIVCFDFQFMGFLINSHIHPYIQARTHLLVGQALVDAASHPFLNANSYVDCNELYEFENSDLGVENFRGPVSVLAKAAIQKAVSSSRTITPRHRKLILT